MSDLNNLSRPVTTDTEPDVLDTIRAHIIRAITWAGYASTVNKVAGMMSAVTAAVSGGRSLRLYRRNDANTADEEIVTLPGVGINWTQLSGTPTTRGGYGITDAAASTHVHGNITSDGKIGTTVGLPIVTTTGGVMTAGAWGGSGVATTFARSDHTHSYAAVNQTMYIGTTAVAINRTTGALSLAGVNIDGSAGSCTGNAATATTATKLANDSGSAPSYSCRAWVNFNGTGTVAIRASGNVSSITDNGTGDYTVNVTTALPDANYSVSGGASNGTNDLARAITPNNTSASSCRITAFTTTTGAPADFPYITATIVR